MDLSIPLSKISEEISHCEAGSVAVVFQSSKAQFGLHLAVDATKGENAERIDPNVA